MADAGESVDAGENAGEAEGAAAANGGGGSNGEAGDSFGHSAPGTGSDAQGGVGESNGDGNSLSFSFEGDPSANDVSIGVSVDSDPGFFAGLFGIDSITTTTVTDGKGNTLGKGFDLGFTLSPVSIAASLAFGIPGSIASKAAEAMGFEDPTAQSFNVDTGIFGLPGQQGNPNSDVADSLGDGMPGVDPSPLKVKASLPDTRKTDEFESIVEDILKKQTLTAFDMPNFKLLNNDFGKDFVFSFPSLENLGEV